MIHALSIITLAACVIVLATVIAQLGDAQRRPEGSSPACWLRHHGSWIGQLLLGSGAGMVGLATLTGQQVSLEAIALIVGIAIRQLTHPSSWWRYVAYGRPR